MLYNPYLINCYIEASTKDKLIELQLLNNEVNGKQFNYQTPYKDGKKYVVWFFADISRLVKIDETYLKLDKSDLEVK